MGIIQLAMIAVVGAMLSLWLKGMNPSYSIYMAFATGLLILFFCLDSIRSFLDLINQLSLRLGDNAVYLKLICKLIGIAYISEFASAICKDAGYQALSSQVEMAGRFLIIVCAIPILTNLMDVIEEVF